MSHSPPHAAVPNPVDCAFSWLVEKAVDTVGSLAVLARKAHKMIFRPFHFSAVAQCSLKNDRDVQLQDIRALIAH
jgi:hypothetical protein